MNREVIKSIIDEVATKSIYFGMDLGAAADIKEATNRIIEEQATTKNTICKWTRTFDNHFNISCVNETGERANGNFKGKAIGAKWEFKFCPYCGGEIELNKQGNEGE